MKILIVAMANSVHTARWINQFNDQGWDIHLFPSTDTLQVHSEIKNVVTYDSLIGKVSSHNAVYSRFKLFIGRRLVYKLFPLYKAIRLNRLIKKIKPNIIHSLEIQGAGYLTLESKKRFNGSFPTWIVTNWGSDIYLFGRLKNHKDKIKEVLKNCDFYSCECNRDVTIARSFGFDKEILPVFPNTGGFDLGLISKFRQNGACSERRFIVLKGYQGWSGRSLVGLRALERCVDILKNYEIAIYAASGDVVIAAELFSEATGISVTIIPAETPHIDILKFQGKARVSISLSISDAISTSLLESIVMGSFPIHSWTSCANEWIINGKTGILVPPEDPDIIEKAIRRALSDDDLVNEAAGKNYKLAEKRLDNKIIKPLAIDFYKSVYGQKELKVRQPVNLI